MSPRALRRVAGLLAVTVVAATVAACAAGAPAGPGARSGSAPGTTTGAGTGTTTSTTPGTTTGQRTAPPGPSTRAVRLPPAEGEFDYQLDDPYPPAAGVGIVVRDRESTAAPDHYGVCYVNGFQTQPQDRSTWLRRHGELVLRGSDGTPVEDPGWPGELLLDIGSAQRRSAAAAILTEQLDTCVAHGFDAVEVDNLDSWTRSRGRLTQADAAAYATLLVDAAHARGLAVAQKNTAEMLGARGRPAFDFAVTEDCGAFDECAPFVRAYGALVLDVEYTDRGLDAACRVRPPVRVVRRDLELAAPDATGHVLRYCDGRP